MDLEGELDPRLYAPDGDPWCRFGKGVNCYNGSGCMNPNHRRYASATGETSEQHLQPSEG